MKLKSLKTSLVVTIIAITLVANIFLPLQATAAGSAVVSVSPTSQTVNSGTQFTVNITVQPNNAIAGAQFNLSFNPALVTVISVSEGNLLKQNGAGTYFTSGTIDNIAGTINGVAGAITTPGQTISTQGTFAIITFSAGTTKGTSSLTLSNVIIGDINGQSISVSVVNGQVSTNHAPVLNAIGNKTVNEGVLLTCTLTGSDPDGDTLTYSAANLPSGATFNAATRVFSWTPSFTQAGSYASVHFQVTDGNLTAFEDITITVNNVNRSPVLTAIGNKTVNEGVLLTFTLTGSDPDGDTLTYSAANLPSGATFNAATRVFSWTPSFTQAGSYANVHFQVTDGNLTASEEITITVNNVNRSPVLTAIGNKTVNEGVLLTFTLTGSDPDGDTLTYSSTNLPSGATFSTTTQVFSWTPNFAQAGSYANVHFQVTDGNLNASEDITITVNQPYPDWDPSANGSVNVLDMITIGQHWGQTGISGWIREDVNHDGAISVLDMIIIGQHWTG